MLQFNLLMTLKILFWSELIPLLAPIPESLALFSDGSFVYFSLCLKYIKGAIYNMLSPTPGLSNTDASGR